MLVKGQWVNGAAPGAPGPDGEVIVSDPPISNKIAPEDADPKRYVLYLGLGCPYAQRTHLAAVEKGLEEAGLELVILAPVITETGWQFDTSGEWGLGPDPHYGFTHVHQLYTKHNPSHTGKVTVPILWDKQTETIVSAESSDIVRDFSTAFNAALPADKAAVDLYPEEMRAVIDKWNTTTEPSIVIGVYKAGFAKEQEAYDAAIETLFSALDDFDAHLATSRYVAGSTFTEADIRLAVVMVRFDIFYVALKCCRKHLTSYKHISGWLRDVYQRPGLAQTVNAKHMRHLYFKSPRLMAMINPNGLLPAVGAPDLTSAHGRESLGAA